VKKRVISSLFGLVSIFVMGNVMATEEPKFQLLEKQGEFELRLYEPMLVAETWVSGSLNQAGSRGFRIIADFIFGNNISAAGGGQEIAMTAPVTMQPESVEIAMTAPVTMEQHDGRWRVHFVMPSKYTYETLPKPNNPAVNIRQIPEKNYAVIAFSGFAGDRKTAQKTEELFAWMHARNLTPIGNPEMARYDPPWRLPFFRRNEVMIAYE